MRRAITVAVLLCLVVPAVSFAGSDDSGAEVNYALIDASLRGDIARVKDLLAKGASVNHLCGGLTPLIAASMKNHLEVARLLLAHRADVNKRSEDGPTALMQASANGNVQLVQLLLDHGADIHAKAGFIWTDVTLRGDDCSELEKLNVIEELCRRDKCCMTALCVSANDKTKQLLTAYGAKE